MVAIEKEWEDKTWGALPCKVKSTGPIGMSTLFLLYLMSTYTSNIQRPITLIMITTYKFEIYKVKISFCVILIEDHILFVCVYVYPSL